MWGPSPLQASGRPVSWRQAWSGSPEKAEQRQERDGLNTFLGSKVAGLRGLAQNENAGLLLSSNSETRWRQQSLQPSPEPRQVQATHPRTRPAVSASRAPREARGSGGRLERPDPLLSWRPLPSCAKPGLPRRCHLLANSGPCRAPRREGPCVEWSSGLVTRTVPSQKRKEAGREHSAGVHIGYSTPVTVAAHYCRS